MNILARIRSGSLPALAGLVLVSGGCAKQVTRVAPEQAIDLSGRWNDVDSRLVAEEIIRQSFEAEGGPSWVSRYMQAHAGRQPTVIVGTIRNRSMEHTPVGTFVRDLERAYLRSGQVQVVASPEERDELRDERIDQQENASADTRARMGRERGASYMLQGDIESIQDREGRRSVVFYQVDMTLVDLETNQKTWVGQHKIKKYVERPRIRL
ncbi:MAG TPA: penicillin-binding protein activator LpoB [Longimicrobiaceae bacterium]|nr:penicillin-binding protein activator LpoB [Longimicrobiaceae bacterium]